MANRTTVSTANDLETNEHLHEKWQTLMLIEVVFLCVISCVGITANVAICKNMLRRKNKSSEYFIINLALTDLSVCAIGIPLQIYENMHHHWKYGAFLCKIIWPYQTLLVLVSIMSLTAMSLERYRAIMTPLKQHLRKTLLLKGILCVWLIGFCAVAPYVNFLTYNGENCVEAWPKARSGAYYTLSLFVIDYCIPLTIITYCYTRSGYKLYTNAKEFKLLGSTASISSLAQRKRLRSNKRVIKRFSFAVVIFLLCMLPGDCFWMWKSFGGNSTFTYEAHFRRFTDILLYANSAINPFIFGAFHATCLKILCKDRHRLRIQRKRFPFHSEDCLEHHPHQNGRRKNNEIMDGNVKLVVYDREDVKESGV